MEWDKCSQSPLYFLTKYGKIRDSLGGIIPWEAWEHLISLLDCLKRHRFIIILKAKQIGITWLMAGANLWLSTFQEAANIFTLSKGEEEATESLDYSRFMHDQLPDFLRLPYGKNQSSLLTFPAMHSKIRALPSTEDAGVGFGGATRVVCDEFEYHRYAEKNYSEIYPIIARGGQLVLLSTADKLRIGTKFKEIYTASKAGDNNFYAIFYPYNVLPYRTEEWYDSLDLAQWEKECRFPRNEKEALETLKTRAFFDRDNLELMLESCLDPIPHDISDKYKGLVKIFRPPVVGKKYCIFADPSDGKDDPHAIIVMDSLGEQVAESHGKVPADMCAQIHDDLVRLYNNAFNNYEINATAGGIFSQKIEELNTPNRCHRVGTDSKLDRKKHGWWTGDALKKKMLWGLEEAIRQWQFIPRSRELIQELIQIMQPEGEEPQAPRGGHDDYTMACGGAIQLKRYLPSGGVSIKSYQYKE